MEECHSVEVVVLPTIGALETMSLSTSLFSLLSREDNELESPELVPVGSDSESDECSDVEIVAPSLQAVKPGAVTKHGVEALDCLSDGITSLFCLFASSDDRAPGVVQHTASPRGFSYKMTGSCTELQFDEILSAASSPGVEMLASIQHWLKLGDLGGSSKGRVRISNRSRARKQSDHVRGLWNQWHPEIEIPLNRTKSLPTTSFPTEAEDSDLYYDSDPGDEHKTRRRDDILTPKHKKARKGSFKKRRPQKIDTFFEDDSDWTTGYLSPPSPRNSILANDSLHSPDFKLHPLTPKNSEKNCSFFSTSPRSVTESDLFRKDREHAVQRFVQVSSD